YLHGYGVCRQKGYAVLGIGQTRFLVKSWREYAVSLLLDTAYFAPQLHESAGGLPKTKLVSHSCSLAGSTSAMEVSIPIAFMLPGREHECNESFKLGRSPALS
ncbi:hypothetical protein Tco_1019320, partial [Tanacetum coccineum]